MNLEQEVVAVLVDGERTINVEATVLGGEEDVSIKELHSKPIKDAIENITSVFLEPIRKAKPSKAVVEFGIGVGVESGKLAAFWVKGTAKANVKVTLEWNTSTEK